MMNQTNTMGNMAEPACRLSASARRSRHAAWVMLLVCAGAAVPMCARSEVSSAASAGPSTSLQDVRRHMLEAPGNMLNFRSMDRLFQTRQVSRAGDVWTLPARSAALGFDYASGGATFAARQFEERTFTNALLILKHGTLVYENYRNQSDARSHFASFSMAKSIVSLLIGVALSDGRIHSLDDAVERYIPELRGSGYEGVSIRNLLRMRSGVAYDERYDFGAHSPAQQVFEQAIVQNTHRFADMAPSLTRRLAPGKQFNYSTMDTAVLAWMLEKAVGQPISTYMTEKLWEPLGMESSGFWIADGPPGIGRALAGMGYNAVARDYARLGQMALQGGRVGARQIVPQQWLAESTASTLIDAPPPASNQPPPPVPLGYGYQWWTLHGTGMFMAMGLQGQFIFVDPKTETVVVKLSYFPPGDDFKLLAECIDFFRAAAAWSP